MRAIAGSLPTLSLLLIEIAPGLALGVDPKNQDLRALLTGDCLVPFLEGHVSHSAWPALNRRAFVELDLDVALQVVVKFFARMPMPVHRRLGRDLHEINEHFAVGRKLLGEWQLH